MSPPGYWNGVNQPDKRQVNIEYLEHVFESAEASGEDIWLATLVFDYANGGDGSIRIDHTLDAHGAVVWAFGQDVSA